MDRAVFASLLADRRMAACICGAAALHLGLTACGLSGWPCPVLSALGITCPGCGLSRAALLLVRGEFGRAVSVHAFAPLLVGALTMLFLTMSAGPRMRERLAGAMRRVEMRTRFSWWLLLSLVTYWIARLALDLEGLRRVVR